jgi:hypothetical protein
MGAQATPFDSILPQQTAPSGAASAAPSSAPGGTPFDNILPAAGSQPTGNAPGTTTGSVASIGATPQPKSLMGKLADWTDNVSADLQDGGDRTGLGTVMAKLGAHGLHNGNSAAVGDFMGSLPLGLLKAGKGTAEVTPQVLGGEKGKTIQGVKDLVGGGLQAMQIPSAVVAPEFSGSGEIAGLSPYAKGVDPLLEGVSGPESAGAIKAIQNAAESHPFVAKLLSHALADTALLSIAKQAKLFGK